MAAAFMLGAEGVQIGTRFLASEECQIHPTFKELVIKAKDTDNIVTGRYTGHPCRNIKTKFAKKLATGEKDGTLSPEEFEQLTVGALRRAVVDGDVDSGSFLCGAISGMVNEIKTCAEIVKEINDGAEKLLGR
jgi:enoyl-[acyl-carrier protein] reductase II